MSMRGPSRGRRALGGAGPCGTWLTCQVGDRSSVCPAGVSPGLSARCRARAWAPAPQSASHSAVPVHPWDSASHLCRALMRGGLEGGPGRRSARLRATHDTPTSVPTEVALGRPRGEVRGASVMETLPQWPASICF